MKTFTYKKWSGKVETVKAASAEFPAGGALVFRDGDRLVLAVPGGSWFDAREAEDEPVVQCGPCGHLQVSHGHGGCEAQLRPQAGTDRRPCPCEVPKDQVRPASAPNAIKGGADRG